MNCKQKNSINGKDLELRIIIGEDCNLNCSYCTTEKTNRSFNKIDELIVFIKRLVFKNITLEFMGGESLLYIKNILKIILEIEKIIPRFYIKIITNGGLLIKKHIQNVLSIINKKHSLLLMVSIHSELPNLDWLKNNKINFYTSKPINGNEEINEEIDDIFPTFFNYDGLEKTKKYTKEIIFNDNLIDLDELFKITKFNFKNWNCNSGKNLICINVDGLVYPCPMYLFYKLDGVSMEDFVQKETICKLKECWEFTSERRINEYTIKEQNK